MELAYEILQPKMNGDSDRDEKKSNQIPSVAHFFWLHFGVAFDIAFEAIHYKKLSHFIIIQPKHTHILSTTLCRSLELHAPMWCDTYTDTHTLTQTNRHKSRCIIFASLKTIYLFYIKSGPEQNNKKNSPAAAAAAQNEQEKKLQRTQRTI